MAALTLPYYTRDDLPRKVVPARDIGRLDVHSGYFTSNFDCFPSERLDTPLFSTIGLVAPTVTNMASGFCFYSKEAFLSVGGYRDVSGWVTAYSDQLALSVDLQGAGWRTYHSADPRLGAIHLKFGAAGSYTKRTLNWSAPNLSRTADDIIALASVPRVDTGCRTADDKFGEEMIGLFFACYAAESPTGGSAWAIRTYRDYVIGGQLHTSAYTVPPSTDARLSVWRRGLARGATFAMKNAPRAIVESILNQVEVSCVTVGESLELVWGALTHADCSDS
jgi:hypothetical protein